MCAKVTHKDLIDSSPHSVSYTHLDVYKRQEQSRELIRDNLEIDIRSQDRHYDLDRVNEIVEIMRDAAAAQRCLSGARSRAHTCSRCARKT